MISPGMILNGRYRLMERIGEGGSGSVFLAEDIFIRKRWALKLIPYEKKQSRRLAKNETEIMGAVEHRAFPRIVDAFRTEVGYCIVSDYIEGRTLQDCLKKERIPLRQKCVYALRILSALRYLHEREPKVLYLDLKPENVMLTKEGELKLIDFGIAERTVHNDISFGTVGYAAPEQYKGEALDERTDIFSFGMLFYAMLLLGTPDRDLEKQRRLIRRNNSIPRELRRLILRCTAENKECRYPAVRLIERDLKRYLGRPKRRILFFMMTVLVVMLVLLIRSLL